MEAFIGEIRLVGFDVVPSGWARCDGSIIPINRNTALFAVLGTTYGGNGTTTFALPDLRGRAIVGVGQGAGLTAYPLGAKAGAEQVPLTVGQMPAHAHPLSGTLQVSTSPGTLINPNHAYLAASSKLQYAEAATPDQTMGHNIIAVTAQPAGAGQPHENRQPFVGLNYLIATIGIPPQST